MEMKYNSGSHTGSCAFQTCALPLIYNPETNTLKYLKYANFQSFPVSPFYLKNRKR